MNQLKLFKQRAPRSKKPTLEIQPHPVLYIDPPWTYDDNSHERGTAEQHYELMTLNDLKSLPIPSLLAKKAHVFMWATGPKMNQAFTLLDAWSLTHVALIPWLKVTNDGLNLRQGTGYWSRGVAEYLVIARTGNAKKRKDYVPPLGLFVGENHPVLYHPRSKHSAKPTTVHEWIESAVEGPYIELFARQARPNWLCIGSDLGFRITSQGVVKT